MYFVTLGWNDILTKTVKNEKLRSLIYRVLTVLLVISPFACWASTGIFKFMKNKPTGTNPESIWEESSSIDDCIQIAIWRIIPFCEVRNIFVVIYDQNSKIVKTYVDTDGLIQDLWKSFSNVPFDDGEKDLVLGQDWFIFEKGTEREDIWQWFDAYYSKGVVTLLYPESCGK